MEIESKCPNCGYPVFHLGAYFDLSTAAVLVMCSYSALLTHLSRHKRHFPPLYRYVRPGGRRRHRIRVLSGREIQAIRSQMFRGEKIPPVSRILKCWDFTQAGDADESSTVQEVS